MDNSVLYKKINCPLKLHSSISNSFLFTTLALFKHEFALLKDERVKEKIIKCIFLKMKLYCQRYWGDNTGERKHYLVL